MSTPTKLTSDMIPGIFKRDDIRGIWPDELNCQVAMIAGTCLVGMMKRASATGRYVIGHDARTGSYELACALRTGIEQAGGTVEFIGLCSSEQVYYMAGRYGEAVAVGCMVTASHNPAVYNGMKFVHGSGTPFTAQELQELKAAMCAAIPAEDTHDVSEEFSEYMYGISGSAEAIRLQPGERMRIVVQAGNGVGARAFAGLGERLKKQGIEVIYVEAEPDGTFPNGVPNPLLPEYNARLGEAVRREKADLGIGFDGDADRAGFVDERGEPVIGSQVLAIVAKAKLAKANTAAGRPVVMRNLCCSQLLKDEFAADGAVELIDTPVGHGQIKQLMRHKAFCDRVVFAGEHSGHYFYPEFFSVDSGMLTSLYMIQHLVRLKHEQKTLGQYLETWRRRYLWSGEINFKLKTSEDVQKALETMRHFHEDVHGRTRSEIRVDEALGLPRAFPAEEGTKTAFPDVKIEEIDARGGGWWFVVRPSGNEPMLRLNVEVWERGAQVLIELVEKLESIIVSCGGKKQE